MNRCKIFVPPLVLDVFLIAGDALPEEVNSKTLSARLYKQQQQQYPYPCWQHQRSPIQVLSRLNGA